MKHAFLLLFSCLSDLLISNEQLATNFYYYFQALLGAQAVITLVMISFMQKLKSYSFARWLLCSQGLYRYLYPTDSELRVLSGKDKAKGRKGGKNDTNGKKEIFQVPRSLEITLEKAPVTPLDVIHLRFYTEYYWIVDFALYTAIVYILSEVRTY